MAAKIPFAYCYETDSIESAGLAISKKIHQKQEDHYFCPSPHCGLKLRAHHRHDTGKPWFRSDDITPESNHINGCPYKIMPRDAAHETSRKRNSKDSIVELVVSDVFGIAPLFQCRNSWPEAIPTREQIARRALQAKPAKIPGDIEDIVDAYEYLKSNAQLEHSLEINGQPNTYKKVFEYLWELPMPWTQAIWDKHIVYAYCKIKRGNVDGIWFLNVCFPKDDEKRKKAISVVGIHEIGMLIRKKSFIEDRKKQNLELLLNETADAKKNVILYWNGLIPQKNDRNIMSFANSPSYKCYAIRPSSP